MSAGWPRVVELAEAALRSAGWEILYSGVLFLVLLSVTAALRKGSASLRHALWGLVLLRLVLPADLALPLSLGSLVGRSGLVERLPTPWPEAEAVGGVASAGGWATDAGVPEARRPSGPGWIPALAGFWLLGGLGVGVALYRRRRRYRRLVARSRPADDVRVRSLLDRWAGELGVRRPIRVVTSPEPCSPFTTGAWRPVIYLPDVLLRHPDGEVLESVLAHELAHVRRWDDMVLLLELVVLAAYFFNPVVWLTVARMEVESERSCDDLVLASGRLKRSDYGRGLVGMLKLGLGARPRAAPAFGNQEMMKMRLDGILKGKRRASQRATISRPYLTALAMGVFLLPMASGHEIAGERLEVAAADRPESVVAPEADVQEPALRLLNPMPESRVSAAWGPMINPFTGEEAHHRGVDLVGRPGARIYAAAAGRVEEATERYPGGADHGTVVLVDHGRGVKTFYSHLAELGVEKGQRVGRGDFIGTQGATGKVTGPHLHFEVWVNGEYRDPGEFVEMWR